MAIVPDEPRLHDRTEPAEPGPPTRGRPRWLRWAALAAAVLAVTYLSTGLFAVGTDEQAVVRRFGRIVARVGPGMHYRLPWPIDRVDVVKTTTVMKAGVGFALPDAEGEAVTGMEVLTGDTNIISLAVVLQYVIGSPADFLFQTEDPQTLIGSVAESVLTELVVGMPVDEVLTTGRLAIQEQVKVRTQEVLDRYQSGVQLTSASIMAIVLDKSVAQAFQDVASAIADREKKINEARAYANNLLPKARGEAHSLVLAAQSYRQQRVAEASGDASRFLSLLAEYQKAPEVTRGRLYLEAMEKILPKVKKYVVDSERGRVPLNLRMTDR
jgi:membrane protease subunit HflK